MDHRGRPRNVGLNRLPGPQARASRVPVPLHVEQEAREGEEWEREPPRPRTPTYRPAECEELPDAVMGKATLSLSWHRGLASPFLAFGHSKLGLEGRIATGR